MKSTSVQIIKLGIIKAIIMVLKKTVVNTYTTKIKNDNRNVTKSKRNKSERKNRNDVQVMEIC